MAARAVTVPAAVVNATPPRPPQVIFVTGVLSRMGMPAANVARKLPYPLSSR